MKSLARMLCVLLLALTPSLAFAAGTDSDAMHGLSLYGAPDLPKDFTHFPYANPDAPKGGIMRMAAMGSYDSVNPFILKGVAAADCGIVFDTLMEASLDEPFSQYGRLAESVIVAKDKSTVTYQLRPEAKFSDGTPVTADDVIFSFETLRDKGHPSYRTYYKDVARAEKVQPHGVRFVFRTKNNTELPMIMGQLPVLSKKFWQGKEFGATTLSPILGSGPYVIENISPGRSITYKRVANWWGENLPVNKGRYNFDRLQYDYYRDTTVLIEAFLAGRYDIRLENTAKYWASAYNTPAVKQGIIKKQEIANALPTGMQGFVMNLRKPLFQDPRVREALDYAFDFEWSNKAVAFGAYKRTSSYFENSELAAKGMPSEDELALLNPLRGQIPDSVFTTPYTPPKTDGTGDNRANLTKATALLREAGWQLDNGVLKNAKGEAFTFEILDSSPIFERWIAPYQRNLERLGIKAQLRTVDTAQYQSMLDRFDFDMTIHVFSQSLSPGNEQRDFWSSGKADQMGSRNIIGIKSPAIDTLVDKIIAAPDRKSLVTATRALDRVLLAGHYVVPHWYNGVYRIAYWDKFEQPKTAPRYGLSVMETWWSDAARASKIDAAQNRKR